MRTIDADKLYPDCMTKNGTLAISQSQIANAPTVETKTITEYTTAYGDGYQDGHKDGYDKGYHDAQRPKGEWVLIKNSDGVLKCYECSECKKCQGYISNFCEDCGADMRGDAEVKNIDPIIKAIQENNAKYYERPNIDFSRMSCDLGGGKKNDCTKA